MVLSSLFCHVKLSILVTTVIEHFWIAGAALFASANAGAQRFSSFCRDYRCFDTGRSIGLFMWWTSLLSSPQALAEALKHNTSIITIDLSYNRIGDLGVQAHFCSECISPFHLISPAPGISRGVEAQHQRHQNRPQSQLSNWRPWCAGPLLLRMHFPFPFDFTCCRRLWRRR